MVKIWLRIIRPAIQVFLRLVRQEEVSLSVGFHHYRFGLAPHVLESKQEPPWGLTHIQDSIFINRAQVHYYASRGIWRLADVFLDPDSGAITVNRKNVLEAIGGSATKPKSRLLKPIISRRSAMNFPAIGAGQKPRNYYHWLIEDLPSVIRAKRFDPSAVPIVSPTQPAYVRDSLQAFGVEVEYSDQPRIFDQLVLAGRGNDSGWPHPEDVGILRDFSSDFWEASDSGQRIYISRSKSRRGIQNEEQLHELLKTFGFKIVHSELLSFHEQVNLFASASLVLGPHGAGLSNLVFMKPESKVIELAWAGQAIQCFEVLAFHSGISFERFTFGHESRTSSPPLREEELVELARLIEK